MGFRLAKEKRERLRSAHLAPDYVPLGGASLAELESRLKPEGGLNAERDEQSGSDDEDPDRRLKFVGSNRQTGLFSQARESEVRTIAGKKLFHNYNPGKHVWHRQALSFSASWNVWA